MGLRPKNVVAIDYDSGWVGIAMKAFLSSLIQENPSKRKDMQRCIDRNPFETALKLFGTNNASGEESRDHNKNLVKCRRATPKKYFDHNDDQESDLQAKSFNEYQG